MIKAIIFDVDNTLIDFYHMKKISISEAIDAMIDAGLEIKKEQAYEIIHQLFKEIGMESHDLYQQFSKKILGKINHHLVAAAVVAHKRTWSSLLHTYPGVIRTLINLQKMGLKFAIVSDAPKLHAHERLAGMKIADFFEVVVTHSDTHKYKPARRPFQHALNLLKQKPENCMMVGDWIKGDIIGAKKMGMKTCLAKYGAPTKDLKKLLSPARFKKYKIHADYTLNKFEELYTIVKKLNK